MTLPAFSPPIPKPLLHRLGRRSRVEGFGIEGAADPFQQLFVALVVRVLDGLNEIGVAPYRRSGWRSWKSRIVYSWHQDGGESCGNGGSLESGCGCFPSLLSRRGNGALVRENIFLCILTPAQPTKTTINQTITVQPRMRQSEARNGTFHRSMALRSSRSVARTCPSGENQGSSLQWYKAGTSR
jgi:hypothetical protein